MRVATVVLLEPTSCTWIRAPAEVIAGSGTGTAAREHVTQADDYPSDPQLPHGDQDRSTSSAMIPTLSRAVHGSIR